jgi:hypothetical protein
MFRPLVGFLQAPFSTGAGVFSGGGAVAALTLILLTWRIRRAPYNVSKWQMGFNSAFKGLVHRQPPSGAKVTSEWRCTSRSPICRHGVYRENFQDQNFVLCGTECAGIILCIETETEEESERASLYL